MNVAAEPESTNCKSRSVCRSSSCDPYIFSVECCTKDEFERGPSSIIEPCGQRVYRSSGPAAKPNNSRRWYVSAKKQIV